MKKTIITVLLALAALLVAGCDKEVHTYMPASEWKQVDEGGFDMRAVLAFSDRTVEVRGATSHTSPLFDDLFDYFMNDRGDEMEIYYYEEVYDGDTWNTERVAYRFDVAMADAGRMMTLVYYPGFGQQRVMRFRRM